MAVECCKTSPLKRQRGFVMLAVMWVLLAMLAGVSLFAHWVHRSLDHAQTRQDSLNAQIAARSAMNTALFIRLTGQRFAYGTTVPDLAATDEDVLRVFPVDDMGARIIDPAIVSSLETFPFDNQVWQYGNLNFVAQDAAGLVGFTIIDHRQVVRHLLGQGRTLLRPQQLIDSYLDYRDKDHRRRLNGAEAFEYRLRERAEPFNGVLRTPLQLRDVLHWDRVLEPWSNGELLYRLRIEGGAAVNVNSASREVLEMVLDDPGLAEEIFQTRRLQPYTSVFPLEAKIDREAVSLTIQPAGGLRFWWWEESSPSAWVHEFQFDALRPGAQALTQQWVLRVDIPNGYRKQAAKPIEWSLLPEFPDYLGRR